MYNIRVNQSRRTQPGITAVDVEYFRGRRFYFLRIVDDSGFSTFSTVKVRPEGVSMGGLSFG